MRAVAKLLRARASEHSSNFSEQFEQRPNFASKASDDHVRRFLHDDCNSLKTLKYIASYADVLRLVTRSSPRGEERVTSLRTSA